jgi:hypothetical protein
MILRESIFRMQGLKKPMRSIVLDACFLVLFRTMKPTYSAAKTFDGSILTENSNRIIQDSENMKRHKH